MTLEEVRARLDEAAVILDFDGTLAPIVERPEDARALPEAAGVLAALRPRVRRLAIVTGRPAAFVESQLPGTEVAGLYGNEDAPPLEDPVRDAVAEFAAGEPGVHVEDKGSAIAVHLRRSPDPPAAAARLHGPLARLAAAAGLDLLEGKQVLELARPGADKGTAVRRLAEGAGALMVAGDDLADLSSFDVARELGRSGVVVALVAVAGPETPAELLLAGETSVEGPVGLLRLLASM